MSHERYTGPRSLGSCHTEVYRRKIVGSCRTECTKGPLSCVRQRYTTAVKSLTSLPACYTGDGRHTAEVHGGLTSTRAAEANILDTFSRTVTSETKKRG